MNALYARETHNFLLHSLPFSEQAEKCEDFYYLEFLASDKRTRARTGTPTVERVRDFILELGYGFVFIRNQYRLPLGRSANIFSTSLHHRF